MTSETPPPPGNPAAPEMRDAAVLELFVLGLLALRWAAQEVCVRTRKAFVLLTYLAMTRRPHSQEQLARLLWPDHEEGAARALLRTTFSQLRRHLAAAGGVETAKQLIIAESTAKYYVTSIFNKFGVDCRAQGVGVAAQRGFL